MAYPPPGPNQHPYPPTMSYPSAPGYPPQNPSNPSYPPAALSYPPMPSSSPYPPSNASPYPSSNASPYPSSNASPYPSSNASPYPSSNPPYPSSNAPYPSSNPPYPPSNAPYPTTTQYPPSNAGYPPTNSAYPPTNAPYPSSNSAYPPSGSPYPPTNAPYPQSGGGAGYSPYPSQAPGYPGQPQGYPPQAGYPSGAYPPQRPAAHSHSYGALGSAAHAEGTPKNTPTVLPANPFNPNSDAEQLRKAMKGFGTDEAKIIEILARRTNQQRMEISQKFRSLYGKDLVKQLQSELSGTFELVVVALMTPLYEFYAKELKEATAGLGTKESTIIQILCTISNSELHQIKHTYQRMFNVPLERDLQDDTSGYFGRLLHIISGGSRDESTTVDLAAATADARSLFSAGEKTVGTDETMFNAILANRNFAQLRAIFSEYQKLTGHPFEKAVQSEFSGSIETALLSIVKCARSRPGYLAECLHNSMSGMGTNDKALIRLMVTRCEVDLGDIKREYAARYGKTLESSLKSDTSGDYRKMLVALQA